MKRVLATGTFEFLHPGHLHFLSEARKLGDELVVLVARDSMIRHKPRPIIPERQRLEMVSALRVVDRAVLGSERDIFEPLYEIRPDVIALGYDQKFDERELTEQLKIRGFDVEVVRITSRRDCSLCSSASITEHVLKRASREREVDND
ncbi:adenylyltransferase/cytidyltransferase family protein [Methermicoccus shengliensis]|uniref:FAD synthase n=1 Tax=Methermicoccus shengliensis TaxID=660064 RepID=A0A832RXE1_9EURY|nr:adenylyltransferase/cytidyltransferase family protein [Methermicoccus shengliensis]KUK05227.1 MAG: FAD synthase [Euryarchaeota archaeon 55_53]KUK30846.1 MAG: FAD synthase [Methanosarcinales archeaon 56_1174]MDI3487814.1 synthetase [Methanosarcinales archaeon]MDN5294539.1 synthetase [Methanosarcinales archaeon]HIH69732.1 FAD synthase [Methermicoccus shengliensis]